MILRSRSDESVSRNGLPLCVEVSHFGLDNSIFVAICVLPLLKNCGTSQSQIRYLIANRLPVAHLGLLSYHQGLTLVKPVVYMTPSL